MRLLRKIEVGAESILGCFTLYQVANYLYQAKKLKDSYAYSNRQVEKIQQLIDVLPENQSQYEEFLKTADPDIVSLYNEVLGDVKLRGDVSNEFLQAHNFDSSEDFRASLDNAYNQGKAGDFKSQETFNNLMQDYQNDFFGQAQSITCENYFGDPMIIGPSVGEYSASLFDACFMMQPLQSFVIISAVGILSVCIIDELRNHRRNKKDRQDIKLNDRKKKNKNEKTVKKQSKNENGNITTNQNQSKNTKIIMNYNKNIELDSQTLIDDFLRENS